MSNLKFAETHNLVMFLEKPEESDGFEGIIDFLNASSISYALTVNPTIYTSCIKQFWATAKAKTINGGSADTSPSRWEEELERMGFENLTQKLTFYKAFFSPQWKFLIHTILQCLSAKTTAWNEFSSTMASAIILFLDKQVEGMTKHKKIYVIPCHTKKVFANMKRQGKDFSGRDTPLFPTMIGRKIDDLDADVKVTLVDEAQERNDDNLMFDTGVFDEQEVEVKKVVSTTEVTTASTTTTTVDELTLAQSLIEIKAAKSKAVTTAATTTTTAVTRPKARGVIVQEPSEIRPTTSSSQTSQLPQAKEKGKAKMIEPKKPLKKKDQILVDEEIAQRL
ncbi:hypothetical protein Tco_1321519 [Tanacetum coccineum]